MKTGRKTVPAIMRFLRKTRDRGLLCWPWYGQKTHDGYPRFWHESRGGYAHRFSYKHYRGKIDPRRELDHLCRNRGCVNPWHLEVVTRYENMRRGESPSSINIRKRFCIRNHPLRGKNLGFKNGRPGLKWRVCLSCRRKNHRDKYWKAKAARGVK